MTPFISRISVVDYYCVAPQGEECYYLKDREPCGYWVVMGSPRLESHGIIDREAIQNLPVGCSHPDRGVST